MCDDHSGCGLQKSVFVVATVVWSSMLQQQLLMVMRVATAAEAAETVIPASFIGSTDLPKYRETLWALVN